MIKLFPTGTVLFQTLPSQQKKGGKKETQMDYFVRFKRWKEDQISVGRKAKADEKTHTAGKQWEEKTRSGETKRRHNRKNNFVFSNIVVARHNHFFFSLPKQTKNIRSTFLSFEFV